MFLLVHLSYSQVTTSSCGVPLCIVAIMPTSLYKFKLEMLPTISNLRGCWSMSLTIVLGCQSLVIIVSQVVRQNSSIIFVTNCNQTRQVVIFLFTSYHNNKMQFFISLSAPVSLSLSSVLPQFINVFLMNFALSSPLKTRIPTSTCT